ncbi:MAG: T9SS type A sorting domain-containing protein [Chitinophagales bacterium]|nr:T9SS type A sorting domain-containing protein [Chitinophagales bacterium]
MRGSQGVVMVVVAVLVTAAATSFAQSTFTVFPGDTLRDVITIGDKKILYIKQQSKNGDTLLLAWKKLSVSIADQWSAYICDNGTCYNNLPDTGTMAPVPPGEYGFLSLHINANVKPGTTTIRYMVWDIRQPSKIDTLTWIVTAFATGVANYQGITPRVYSNRKIIYLTQVSGLRGTDVVILDLTGKKILAKRMQNDNETLDMSSFPDGMYVVNLINIHQTVQVFIGN